MPYLRVIVSDDFARKQLSDEGKPASKQAGKVDLEAGNEIAEILDTEILNNILIKRVLHSRQDYLSRPVGIILILLPKPVSLKGFSSQILQQDILQYASILLNKIRKSVHAVSSFVKDTTSATGNAAGDKACRENILYANRRQQVVEEIAPAKEPEHLMTTAAKRILSTCHE
ncbi:hypothetical protein CHS0354_003291 [Potamilus streckersoni]|uniref:Uncharacterized protein n=1 Tax=Potamilus streckersoni TaxID=2493646 RepID=A0AAE0SUU8_9BIVA|nr:hypothetical protein CHS0354_003291 [Potamilus streckersoni]